VLGQVRDTRRALLARFPNPDTLRKASRKTPVSASRWRTGLPADVGEVDALVRGARDRAAEARRLARPADDDASPAPCADRCDAGDKVGVALAARRRLQLDQVSQPACRALNNQDRIIARQPISTGAPCASTTAAARSGGGRWRGP
jgi:hypothetical protein